MRNCSKEVHEVAYYLWITEGKPDGQASKHWDMACRIVDEQYQNGKKTQNRSMDPSEAKGTTEPAQPDQT